MSGREGKLNNHIPDVVERVSRLKNQEALRAARQEAIDLVPLGFADQIRVRIPQV